MGFITNAAKSLSKNRWIIALRPEFWLVSLLPLWIGILLAIEGIPESVEINLLVKIFLASIVVGPLVPGCAYAINQYFDLEGDEKSFRTKHLPLVVGTIRKTDILLYFIFLSASALILSYILGRIFFYLTLIGVICGIIYSVPPIRLKSVPFIDAAANGFSFGILPTLAGWSIVGKNLNVYVLLIALPIALCLAAGHITLAIPDFEIDKKRKLMTTPVFLGKKKAAFLIFILMLLCGLLLLIYIIIGILPLLTLISLIPGVLVLRKYAIFEKGIEENLSFEKLGKYFIEVLILLLAAAFLYMIVLFIY